jgi:hypothetical protein
MDNISSLRAALPKLEDEKGDTKRTDNHSTTTKSLQTILDESPISSLVSDVVDYGYFSWIPSRLEKKQGIYKPLHSITKDDIQDCLDLDGKPPLVKDITKLKELLGKGGMKFKNMKNNNGKTNTNNNNKYTRRNIFPYDPSYLVPLHVASRRGVDLSTINFKFGGSALNMLANQQIDNGVEYVVEQIFGTSILVIQKYHQYTIDLSVDGHQFEEFCCSGKLQPTLITDMVSTIHIQTIKVGNYNILISAECDGLDSNENPIEMKCSLKTKNSKVGFQMISSGSLNLYGANKDKFILRDVYRLGLEEILKEAFCDSRIAKQQLANIQNGLNIIQEAFHEGTFTNGRQCTIQFNKKLRQLELRSVSLLPSENVIKEMLTA